MNIHDNEILSFNKVVMTRLTKIFSKYRFYNIRYSRFTMIVVFEEILIKHAVSWLF